MVVTGFIGDSTKILHGLVDVTTCRHGQDPEQSLHLSFPFLV